MQRPAPRICQTWKTMKYIHLVCFFFVFIVGCKKTVNDLPVCTENQTIVGKWKATQRFWSPGAGGNWHTLTSAEQFTIEFKSDSTFIYSANFPKADSQFSIYSMNGMVLKISSAVNSKTDTWYWKIDDECRLNLGLFPCIEGCPFGLQRID